MRFYPPLDDRQLREAVQIYKALRAHVKSLRVKYPPGSATQKEVLKSYRRLIEDFGKELLKSHGKINSDVLNNLCDQTAQMYVIYMSSHGFISKSQHD